jgi:hypothetical protein
MNYHISDISMYKHSPGLAPIISFAGTRLSEQPIHNGGVCPLAKSAKKFGSVANACSTLLLYIFL